MNTVPDGLNVTISKLTVLLQLALNPSSQENAKSISSAILELIAHTTHLSILTTNLLDEYKERELSLRGCLSDMSALVKVQQKKLQKVRPAVDSADAATSTGEEPCLACIESTNANWTLRQQLVALQTTVESLQGKLVQSRFLLQAQQVVIDDYGFSMNHTKEGPRPDGQTNSTRSLAPCPVATLAPAAEPWTDVFADSQRPRFHTDDFVLNYRRGMPPKLPGHSHRYSGGGGPGTESETGSDQGEDGKAEEEGALHTAIYPSVVDGVDGEWDMYEDSSYSKGRPDCAWLEEANGAQLEEEEEREPWAEDGNGGEQDRNYLSNCNNNSNSLEEGISEDEENEFRADDGGKDDEGEGEEREEWREEWGEEWGAEWRKEWEEEDGLQPRPMSGGCRHEHAVLRAQGERNVCCDGSVPSAIAHKQRHRLREGVHARADDKDPVVGGGWSEEHEGSVEDSFSLIRDFYDGSYS